MKVKQLDHLNLTVNNFKETAEWYKRVFGFEVVEKGTYQDRPWGVLRSDDAMLCIYESPNKIHPNDSNDEFKKFHSVHHFGFRILDRGGWEQVVERENIEVLYGEAYRWPHSHSWYIKDLNGYDIEVVLWDGDLISF